MSSRDGRPAGPSRRSILRGSLAALAGPALLTNLPVKAGAAARSSYERPVPTQSGSVTGGPSAIAGITVYKGLPYAGSTAGHNRWRPPQPAPSWKGVRRADSWGPACPQPTTGLPAWAEVPDLSEDCLNLNIWTGAASSDERRPVFMWLYGGRDTAMWASQPIYDGACLAAKGLVVVTVNYRVGAFGGLATPQLSAETGHHASGNWALLDQIAALKWIHRNITAFGGDPHRVTVAGWSHGAASAYAMIDSPLAKGLFHRAQMESGVQYTKDPSYGHVAGGYVTLDQAEQNGLAFAEQLGATTTAELRALPADTITQAIESPDTPEFRYVLDGWVFPKSFHETLETRSQNDVPVLTGNNRDENGVSLSPTITLTQYLATAHTTFGAMADEYLTLYPATSDAEANEQSNTFARDEERVSTFLWGTQWLAAGRSPAYTYYWSHSIPGTDTSSPITTGVLAAEHGAEMNYIFGNLYGTDRPWTAADRRIADTLSSYVAHFAATGNPNHGRLPAWPALRTSRPAVMEVGDSFQPIPAADTPARFDFIKRWLNAQTTDW